MSVKLGHFELQEQLGKGGIGVVFRAFDPTLNRFVAIKLLDEDLAQDPAFVEEFLREARNAAGINHPHVVQIYFVGEDKGSYYIVMELLSGRSLDTTVVQGGALREDQALQIAIEITEGLKCAYSNEMIHGDVKPQNIFITENNVAKLLDFGLAKLANVEVTAQDGVIWGSAYYVSPERIGQKAEDFRSDIYSLGATLFETLTARPPFDAETPAELAIKRLQEKAPLLRTINPEVSKRTEKIVDKMLQKSPFLRYLDYDSLLHDLREAAAGIGVPESVNLTTVANPSKPIPRKQSPAIVIAAIAAALIIVALLFVLVGRKQPAPVATAPAAPTPSASASPAPPAVLRSAVAPSAVYGIKHSVFHYADATAKSVQIAGSFNQWKPEPMAPEGGGSYVAKFELPRAHTYEYQFIVDGKTIPDPKRKTLKPGPNGTQVSVLYVPKLDSQHKKKLAVDPAGVAAGRTSEMEEPESSEPESTPPAPTPETVDLAALAASPAQWPRVVALKEPQTFPVMLNGRAVGTVKLAPGTQLKLLAIEGDQITGEFQGVAQKLPAKSTDLIERVLAQRKHQP